jgi:hypothetical protein
MAQWQLGNHEQAIRSYRTAVGVMEKNLNARDAAERILRAEAAALFGIKEPAPFKSNEETPGKH